MYKLLFLGLITAIALAIFSLVSDQPSFAVIELMNYHYEMSLFVLIVGLFLFFFCSYLILSFLIAVFSSPFSFFRWFKRRNPKKQLGQIQKAQKEALSGDLEKAADDFYHYAKKYEDFACYLQASLTYLNLNQYDKAKDSLNEAAKYCLKKDRFSFRLVQLRYFIAIKSHSEATKLAQTLFNLEPRNKIVIELCYQLYQQSENYDEMIDLLIAMKKVHLFDESTLTQIEQNSYAKKLEQLIAQGNNEQAQLWWSEQPRSVRKDDHLLAIYHQKVK